MREKIVSVVLALAMCVTMTVPAFAANTSGFTDVDARAYYAKPIAWAVEQGITKGTSSTTFSPGDDCTVAQILTFLWRGAGRPGAISEDMAWSDELTAVVAWAKTKGINDPDLDRWCTRSSAVEFMWKAAGSPDPAVTAEFEDVPPYASYAKAVSWALEKGVTNGSGSLVFSPNVICSRGNIVTFLYREAVEPLETTLPSREAMLSEFVRLINEERAKAGVSALKTYTTLSAAAQLRSAELVKSISHTRPDGTNYTTALTQTGADQNVVASEELVTGGGSNSPSGMMEVFRITQKLGDQSLSVILDPKFTHVGIGYTYSDSGKTNYYWTLILTTVDGEPNNGAVPDTPQSKPQYDEDGVLVSTDPYIKLSYLICDRLKENAGTSISKSFTGLLMDKDSWRGYHGQKYTVSWKADDPSIISLEEKVSDGIVTGVFINPLKAGKTTITCTVTGQDGYSAEAYCYVTVQPRTGQTPTTPSDPSTNMTAEQMCARVVELVNQERSKQGLTPLSTMPSLTAAAGIRAQELTVQYNSDHTRPDGSSCFTVFREAGVTGYFTAGENIASGQRSPEQVMNDWMNSPGHKANILSPDFTHIGVGYSNNRWVQMFIGAR